MNDIERELRTFLTATAELIEGRGPAGFRSQYRFLLKQGTFYRYAPLPKNVKPMTIKLCFANAYALAQRRRWWYVEGWALNRVIPVHHAWVVRPGSREVIDPTWVGTTFAPQAYLGVPFKLDLVREVRKRESTVLDDWPKGRPLLCGEIPEEEWKVL